VRIVAEFNRKSHVAAPVDVSNVPLGCTGAKVFVTQTESPAFEIGSGRPKRQPTSVQSTPAGVEPDVVEPMLHVVPTHPESVKRFVAPPGVALSGTCERPPPSERPPQRSFFNVTVAPTSRNVLPQSPVADVERKSKPPLAAVVDVVDVVVVTVVDAATDVLVVEPIVVVDVLVVEPTVMDEVLVVELSVVDDVVVVGAVVLELEVVGATVDDVVVVPGLHAAGSALRPGIDARSAQSTS
jgi:hypothetical protein